MRLMALVALVGCLLGAEPAMSQGLPEGVYASTESGCGKLKEKTAAELGEELDFFVFSKTGLTSYLQKCDFVHVTSRNQTSWVVTAFCEESNFDYPDVLAVAQKEGGNLKVTRLTEVARQEPYDDELADEAAGLAEDMDPSELDNAENSEESDQAGDDGSETDEGSDDSVGTYFRCGDVKK
jgi:hypothetical protein